MIDQFTIELQKQEELRRRCLELQQRVGSTGPLLDRIGLMLVRSVKKNFTAGGRPTAWPQSKSAAMRGGKTLMKKGVLRNSITHVVESATSVKVGMSPEAQKYGTVLHYGGKLTSSGKMFTIPLNDKAAKVREQVKSLREVPNLFILKRGENLTLMKAKKGAAPEPWFALKRSITMPAFPFMVMQIEDKRRIEKTILTYVVEGRAEDAG